MNKGLVAGIMISLIAGIALGYFVIPMIFADGSQGAFYSDQEIDSYNLPDAGYDTIPNLNISFSTDSGVTVVYTFTCELFMDPDMAQIKCSAYFRFVLDGVSLSLSSEQMRITTSVNGDNDWQYFSVVYRYIKSGISSGPHNVSIEVSSDGSFDEISTSLHVLTVQVL